MQITKSGEFTPALITDPSGNSGRPLLAPSEIVSVLDKIFDSRLTEAARAPGLLSQMIGNLSPEEMDTPVSPRLTAAVFTARTTTYVDQSTERRAAEMGILGQRDGYFHNNNNAMIVANNFLPTERNIEELGAKTVRLYLQKKLINKDDTVIDIGTGKGYFPKFLEEKGISVVAIEPGIVPEGEKIVFPKTHRCTVEEFSNNNPEKQFSLVNVCNFSPYSGQFFEMSAAKEMIAILAKLTKDNGHTLIGISSIDPQFVSGVSQNRLRPHLEKQFKQVEYLSAKKFASEGEEIFSIGGQLGVFKCSSPKRP